MIKVSEITRIQHNEYKQIPDFLYNGCCGNIPMEYSPGEAAEISQIILNADSKNYQQYYWHPSATASS